MLFFVPLAMLSVAYGSQVTECVLGQGTQTFPFSLRLLFAASRGHHRHRRAILVVDMAGVRLPANGSGSGRFLSTMSEIDELFKNLSKPYKAGSQGPPASNYELNRETLQNLSGNLGISLCSLQTAKSGDLTSRLVEAT